MLPAAQSSLMPMRTSTRTHALRFVICSFLFASTSAFAGDETAGLRKAFVDGSGPGWRTLTFDDFVNVNCDADTWSAQDGMIHCKGLPVGVARLNKTVKNFELVLEWRHLQPAGNSGVFVWVTAESLAKLNNRARLPSGIEVQVLDHGYLTNYEKQTGKKADWFTTN